MLVYGLPIAKFWAGFAFLLVFHNQVIPVLRFESKAPLHGFGEAAGTHNVSRFETGRFPDVATEHLRGGTLPSFAVNWLPTLGAIVSIRGVGLRGHRLESYFDFAL